ncbi:MAG: hypothetical protein ACI8UO_002372 [Verrucomicrobiales bacterium]|jgi:hypothetical protein
MKTSQIRFRLITLFTALFAITTLQADVVTLTDGTVIEGTVVDDKGDFVVIDIIATSEPKGTIFLPEDAEGSTIRDKKRIPKGEVESIERPDEADLKFELIQQLLPTKSLVAAADYRTLLLEPTRFLTDFSESPHVEAVTKIKDELNDELAKVEGGFIKIQGEWITKEERNAHRGNTDARIAYYHMLKQAQQGGSGFLTALRTFDQIENRYRGATIYPDSIVTALQVLPIYGNQLQRDIKNFAYLDAQRKKGEATLSGQELINYQRNQTLQKKQFDQAREAAKKRGDRWLPINQFDIASLQEGVKIVRSEMERLRELDRVALQKRANGLYEIETLLASAELETLKVAEEKLKELLKIKVGRGKSKDEYTTAIQEKLEAGIERAEALVLLAERNAAASPDIPEPGTAPAAGANADKAGKAGAEDDPLAALERMRPKVENTPEADSKKKTSKKSTKKTRAPAEKKDYSDWKPKTSITTIIMYIGIAIGAVMAAFTGFLYLKNRGDKD